MWIKFSSAAYLGWSWYRILLIGSVLKGMLSRHFSEATLLVKFFVVGHVRMISGRANLWQLDCGSLFSRAQKVQSLGVSVYFALMWGVPTVLCLIFRMSLLSFEDTGVVFNCFRLFLKVSCSVSLISGILLQYLVEVSWLIVGEV